MPDVESVSATSHVPVRIEDFSAVAVAATASDVSANFKVDMSAGTLDALAGDTILIDRTTADLQGWRWVTDVNATVGTLADHELRVGGIYEDSQAFAHMIVDRSLYLAAVPLALQSDVRVFVRATPGADLAQLRAELTDITSPYLVVSVQDRSEFAAEQGAAIDTVLNLLYVLLLFSVVIAVLGIVNTLALSVLERTREIGLLRAVGLLRSQLGGVITIEAIATAVFGAILGTAARARAGHRAPARSPGPRAQHPGHPLDPDPRDAGRVDPGRSAGRSRPLHPSRAAQHPAGDSRCLTASGWRKESSPTCCPLHEVTLGSLGGLRLW